jgi:hypothetical protein
MDRVKDVIWTGFKNTGVAMTFGAYHLYVMDENGNSNRKFIDYKMRKQKRC